MRGQRFQSAALACASLAGTVFLFEAALFAPGGGRDAASYLAAIAALTLAVALAIALLATLAAGRAAPQAAVISLAAITLVGAGADFAPLDAALAGAVTLVLVLAVALDRELRRHPTALALLSGAALCAVFRIWPRLCHVVPPLRPLRAGLGAAAAEALVFAGCVAAALAYSAVRRSRLPRLPGAATVATTTLALCTIAIVAADTRGYAAGSIPPAPAPADVSGLARREERPSILVLLLDTVGAGRLSIYGHSRPTTPELQGFLDRSERAVLYPLAFAPASWTAPSHASLFTGLLPSQHGIERPTAGRAMRTPRIRHPRLSQTLRGQGYRTAAIVANPLLDATPGIFDGFDLVVRARPLHRLRLTPGETVRALWLPAVGIRARKPTPRAELINRDVLDAVRRCAGGACFVFANYMDAHSPYAPPQPYAGSWSGHEGRVEIDASGAGVALERAAARHDEAIRSLDAELGKLLAELAFTGALDRWWIVITADHGEAFGEHGFVAHGKDLHVEQTRIPLLIQPPSGVRLEARENPVSLLDVAATIAALAGVERFGAGDDLRRPAATPLPVAMEFAGRGYLPATRGQRPIPPSRAVVVGRRQLIESAGRRELYDLGEDPRELHDLAPTARDEVERLADFLPPGFRAWSEAEALAEDAAREGDTDEETRRDLRALGYLE